MSLPTVNKSEKLKKTLTLLILCVLVPAVVLIGALVFGSRSYAWISLCVVVLSTVPFFMRFEKSSLDVKRLVLIAALVALSVVGRMAFAAVPGFKPVAALVIITAVHFGGEAGFMVGALSALLSNFYFGQGPWTPFQMFSWGVVGLIAGLLAPVLKKHLVALCAYGALAGGLYSLLMDVWSTLWADGYFNIRRYLGFVVSSASFTLVYAVSNVIFLLVCAYPLGKVLEHLKTKFGI